MLSEQMKAEGWIEHDGGLECPIAKATRIECCHEQGILAGHAGSYRWDKISAYRVLTPEGNPNDH